MALSVSCRRAEDEDVVAQVGRSAITQEEFQNKLSEVSPDYQNYVVTPHGRRQFLQVLIREKLILEAAKNDGVASSQEFQDRMERLKKEEEEKLREAREYLLARLWLDHLRDKGVIGVSDEELKDFHKKNHKEVVARHILLATAEKAETVLNRIRSGTSFAAMAKQHSLDTDTAVRGGSMRPAMMGEVIPELEVLFKMQVKELGGPVRSAFGYHVLLKESQRNIPFDEAVDRMRLIIEKRKLDAHLKSLKDKYHVEVLDAQFK